MERFNTTPPKGLDPKKWKELVDAWKDAPPVSELGHDNLRILLMNLTGACPFGGNPEGCCMHDIRQIPPQDRFEWVNELNDEQLEVICTKHRHCSRCQMQERNKSSDPAS